MNLLISILSFVVFAGAAEGQSITVKLKNAKGEESGTALISPLQKGVRILLDARGLTPGEHAFHFHETGSCVGPKFESAGSHFAPGRNAHGFDHEQGPHAGDMPNVIANNDGTVRVEIVNTRVTLTSNSLLKKGGTAVVIHAQRDDYKSQPAGEAGGRILCGEIKGASK